MKNKPNSHFCKSINRKQSGFALVVTLVLMVLLSILALGLLSLANIELRNTGEREKMGLARQNALLALQIAIGELQKNLGPDMRTSANASLVDANFENTNPNWVGVWNTEGGFRNWLISGNENASQPADPKDDVATNSLRFSPGAVVEKDSSISTGYVIGSTPAVLLVGENSLGSAANTKRNLVFAPTQELKTSSSGNAFGRYAWWVGDDGAKANVAAPVLALPNGGMVDRIEFLSASPNRGFPTLGRGWEKWLPDGSNSILDGTEGKFVSRAQIPLADTTLTDETKERFHDFTVASAGVLSDSKNGGLRKDLSIAFEISEKSFRNSEFTRKLSEGDRENAFVTDHATGMRPSSPFRGRNTKTILNYSDPQFPSGSFYRGPTFDILRDHYQQYRRMTSPFSGSATVKAQPGAPNVREYGRPPWKEYSDRGEGQLAMVNGRFAISDTSADNRPSIRQITNEIVPELIHYAYTLSLQSYKKAGDPAGFSRIRLIVNPFLALYNPYNVVMHSPPIQMTVNRAEVGIYFEYASNPVTAHRGEKDFSLYDPYVDRKVTLSVGGEYQGVDHYISDSGDPHPPASGAPGIVLQPGEIKLYTITGGMPVDVDAKFDSSNPTLSFQAVDPANPAQLFASGLYAEMRYSKDDINKPNDPDNLEDPLLVADGATFTVKVNDSGYLGTQRWNVGSYPKLGNSVNEYLLLKSRLVQPFSGDPTGTTHRGWDQIREIRIFNGSYWLGDPQDNDPLTLSPNQIKGNPSDPDGGQRSYVGQSGVFWKPALGTNGSDDNFSLATHNPRAPAQTTTTSGAQGPNSTRGPATWTGESKRLDGSNPNFDLRFWGTGKNIQDGGSSYIPLWDIPRRPLTSLASLQHANIARLYTNPAFVIGNSYASPYVSSDSLASVSDGMGYWNFDDSYLLNDVLFDSYFFSGINPGKSGNSWKNQLSDSSSRLGASDPTSEGALQETLDGWIDGDVSLANSRLVFFQPSGGLGKNAKEVLDLVNSYTTPQDKLSDPNDIRPHNAMAAFSLNLGAFNVNSTSVEAWRVILAGLRGAEVDHLSQSGNLDIDSGETTSPIVGTTLPGAGSDIGSDEELWSGFRRLNDGEIETLAEEIVSEVKRRSRDSGRPFTTIGEFVNRRLGTNSFSEAGALQAAIDVSGINNSRKLSAQPVTPAANHHITKKQTPAESVTIPYKNSKALASSTIAGAPQWLMQADVLETIGSQLSARSDTFTIRAYGESINQKTGVVEGRAWLEATVQRGTVFVDPSEDPALPLSSLRSKPNQEFGRRFNIVAFRWLSPKEI